MITQAKKEACTNMVAKLNKEKQEAKAKKRKDQMRFTAACAAMQGMLAHTDTLYPHEVSRDAVDYADALIKELEK